MSDIQDQMSDKDTYQPSVTFALFGYNQEKYIREAIEGAFAQNYTPLEIILSDDCSTDNTFAIMQDMAANYCGRHRVRVRRNTLNCGVLSHVLRVAREASGQIILVAAGDDVSVETRSKEIVKLFNQASVMAAWSDATRINQSGFALKQINKLPSDREFRSWFPLESVNYINGATAAYRKSFLVNLPLPDTKVQFEDLVFSSILAIAGENSAYLSAPLVLYRENPTALTNNIKNSQELTIKRLNNSRHARMHYDACEYILKAAHQQSSDASCSLLKSIMQKIECSLQRDRLLMLAYSGCFRQKILASLYMSSLSDMKHVALGLAGVKSHEWLKILKSALVSRK